MIIPPCTCSCWVVSSRLYGQLFARRLIVRVWPVGADIDGASVTSVADSSHAEVIRPLTWDKTDRPRSRSPWRRADRSAERGQRQHRRQWPGKNVDESGANSAEGRVMSLRTISCKDRNKGALNLCIIFVTGEIFDLHWYRSFQQGNPSYFMIAL